MGCLRAPPPNVARDTCPAVWTLLLLACASHERPAASGSVKDPPTLPSPKGEVYATVRATPPDPLVARVARDLPWDEVLSGAAAGVALEAVAHRAVDDYVVRWKAILAGYPFPIVARAITTVPNGKVPEQL